MTAKKDPATRNRFRSVIEIARIEVVRQCVVSWKGIIRLDADAYRILRDRGLSRCDVDRALDAMAARGEAVVESTAGGVRVRLVGARKEGE